MHNIYIHIHTSCMAEWAHPSSMQHQLEERLLFPRVEVPLFPLTGIRKKILLHVFSASTMILILKLCSHKYEFWILFEKLSYYSVFRSVFWHQEAFQNFSWASLWFELDGCTIVRAWPAPYVGERLHLAPLFRCFRSCPKQSWFWQNKLLMSKVFFWRGLT